MQHHSNNPTPSASAGGGSGSSAGGLLSLWGLQADPSAGAAARQRDQNVLRLITVMAEREAAVLEKTAALAEKKAALAERDSALLQRDLALSERDSAAAERDRVLAVLGRIRAEQEACPHCRWDGQSACNFSVRGLKYPFMAGSPENIQPLAAIDQSQELFWEADAASKKQRRAKCANSNSGVEADKPRKRMKDPSLWSSVMPNGKSVHVSAQLKDPPPPEKENHQKLKAKRPVVAKTPFHVRLFDRSKVPSPYCSCTGLKEQCYRWGNGGWQSACCTNKMSISPLPISPKRSRIHGRKMSASAFERLLQRLVSEGWDVSMPVDLKDYWAKHGTNRYVIIK